GRSAGDRGGQDREVLNPVRVAGVVGGHAGGAGVDAQSHVGEDRVLEDAPVDAPNLDPGAVVERDRVGRGARAAHAGAVLIQDDANRSVGHRVGPVVAGADDVALHRGRARAGEVDAGGEVAGHQVPVASAGAA